MAFDQVPHTTVIRVEHDFEFDPVILAPFFIVGFPTYSEYKSGATDLFKPSTLNGGYKYQRSYQFSNGASFSSFHNITFSQESGLKGVFSTRDFPTKSFEGKWKIADLVETFLPNGPGIIKSVMGVEWKGEGEKSLQAVIQSQYYLNHNMELPGLHWRHVTFDTQHQSQSTYIQSEKITVINSLDFGRPQNMLSVSANVSQKLSASKLAKELASQYTNNGVHELKGVANGFSNGVHNGIAH